MIIIDFRWDAALNEHAAHCPFCRCEGKFVALNEELIEKNQENVNNDESRKR